MLWNMLEYLSSCLLRCYVSIAVCVMPFLPTKTKQGSKQGSKQNSWKLLFIFNFNSAHLFRNMFLKVHLRIVFDLKTVLEKSLRQHCWKQKRLDLSANKMKQRGREGVGRSWTVNQTCDSGLRNTSLETDGGKRDRERERQSEEREGG